MSGDKQSRSAVVFLIETSTLTCCEFDTIRDTFLLPIVDCLRLRKTNASDSEDELPNLRHNVWGVVTFAGHEDPSASPVTYFPPMPNLAELKLCLRTLRFSDNTLPTSDVLLDALKASSSLFCSIDSLRKNSESTVVNHLVLVVGQDIPVEAETEFSRILDSISNSHQLLVSFISPYQLLRLPALINVSNDSQSEYVDKKSKKAVFYYLNSLPIGDFTKNSFTGTESNGSLVRDSSSKQMPIVPHSLEEGNAKTVSSPIVASGVTLSSAWSQPPNSHSQLSTSLTNNSGITQGSQVIGGNSVFTSVNGPVESDSNTAQNVVMVGSHSADQIHQLPSQFNGPIPGQEKQQVQNSLPTSQFVWNGKIQWREKPNSQITRAYDLQLFTDPSNGRSRQTDASRWPSEGQVQFIPQDLITPVKDFLQDANYLCCKFVPTPAQNDPLMEKLLSRNVGCISFQIQNLRLVILIYSKKTQIISAIIPNKQDECTAKLRETIKHRQQMAPVVGDQQNPQQPLSAMANLASNSGGTNQLAAPQLPGVPNSNIHRGNWSLQQNNTGLSSNLISGPVNQRVVVGSQGGNQMTGQIINHNIPGQSTVVSAGSGGQMGMGGMSSQVGGGIGNVPLQHPRTSAIAPVSASTAGINGLPPQSVIMNPLTSQSLPVGSLVAMQRGANNGLQQHRGAPMTHNSQIVIQGQPQHQSSTGGGGGGAAGGGQLPMHNSYHMQPTGPTAPVQSNMWQPAGANNVYNPANVAGNTEQIPSDFFQIK